MNPLHSETGQNAEVQHTPPSDAPGSRPEPNPDPDPHENRQLTVTLTRGLPGSGNSTWARRMVAEADGRIVRVNKDDLRAMLHDSRWSEANEVLVESIRDAAIIAALDRHRDVIVDDTNLSARHFEHLAKLVATRATIGVEDFTSVPIDECIRRDKERDRSVGERVIREMFDRHLKGDLKPHVKHQLKQN
jgi:predicted kinase